MQVRFYFDPLCPWCWVTSFWLDEEVAPRRGLHIDWRPISLLFRNEAAIAASPPDRYPASYAAQMRRSTKLLRVVEALRDEGQRDRVRSVYLAFGRHFHDLADGMDFDVPTALQDAGVDRRFADAYDDGRWDAAVRASTAEAEAVAGADVGTPIISYEVDGRWRGYFGPVIPSVPRGEDALKLWDGLSLLIQTEGFFELKRTRDVGPDLASVRVEPGGS